MKIALSTDHAGFEKLKTLQIYLESMGHECHNFGPNEFNQDDDYPDFIFPAAKAVAQREYDAGIIMGGSGQGEAIVANRVHGIRCAVYYGPAPMPGSIDAEGHGATDVYEILRLSRQHNDSNMLSFGGRFLSRVEIEKAAVLWLNTPFSNIERHLRRIQKIDNDQPV